MSRARQRSGMDSSSSTNDCPVTIGRYFGTKPMLRGEFPADRGERALLVLVERGERGADAVRVRREHALHELGSVGGETHGHRAAVVHQAPARHESLLLERSSDLRRVRLRPAQAATQCAQLELTAGGGQHDQYRERAGRQPGKGKLGRHRAPHVRLCPHQRLQSAMRQRVDDRKRRHMRIVGSGADTSGVRIATVLAVGMLLAGCGKDKSERLPAACIAAPQAVVKALATAPGAVTLDGTPISKCFNRGASGTDVQILGTTLLAAAQQLGDRASSGDQTAALRLGYLIGAARRGAKRNGLADEMVRRLQAETTVAPAARAAYARGLRAGSAQG